MISNECINSYIDERINQNYSIIRKDKYYKENMNKFDTIYQSLYNKLSEEEQKQLEEIYAILNSTLSLENYLAYKIGLHDGISIKECICE